MAQINFANRSNPDRKHARISLFFALLCFFGVFLPDFIGMDMERWGYGIAFINGFLTLASLAAWWVFRALAKEWTRITATGELLAHWEYDSSSWSDFLRKDEVRERTNKRNLLRLIGTFMLIVGVLFLAIFRDFGSQVVAIVFLVLWLILAALAKIMPGRQHTNRLAEKAEAIISRRGLIFAGELHSWAVGGQRLEDVSFLDESIPPYLEFTYSAPGRFARSVTSVRVPIPPGNEQEARNIASKLSD